VKSDNRKQPKALEKIDLEPEIRVVCPPGGVVLFSAAHLHSTVPNTSGEARFSMDFRTVNGNDVRAAGGATNVDSTPTGTSLRDFMRCTDLAPFPDDVIAQYDDGSADVGSLVFVPASEDV
jgi:hypothetical protein